MRVDEGGGSITCYSHFSSSYFFPQLTSFFVSSRSYRKNESWKVHEAEMVQKFLRQKSSWVYLIEKWSKSDLQYFGYQKPFFRGVEKFKKRLLANYWALSSDVWEYRCLWERSHFHQFQLHSFPKSFHFLISFPHFIHMFDSTVQLLIVQHMRVLMGWVNKPEFNWWIGYDNDSVWMLFPSGFSVAISSSNFQK